MIDPLDRVVRTVSGRNSFALVWAQFGLAHLITLGGMGLLRLYQPMPPDKFWLLVAISQLLVAADNLISVKLTRRMWRPVWAWESGAHDPVSVVAAWQAAATLPYEYTRRMRTYPFVFAYLPFVAFATWLLGLQWYSFFVLAAVGTIVPLCTIIVRYFTMEVVTRPVLEKLAHELPPDFIIRARGLPLRWRLFAAAPIINIITGVVVAGLSAEGHNARLSDLGLSWVVAVVVSFTISLELVVLVVRSLGSALADLQAATVSVAAGDYSARVPVVATDETGKLAQSFNAMAEGLEERERLREAFGAYVDPDLAERVLAGGADLTGEEVEVSILFLDIWDFTSFAEQASPHEVVSMLNEFWDLIVPVLLRGGGHANKFIGDGLLAVFGAPDRLADHADRAVATALELVGCVSRRYGSRVRVGVGVNSGPVVVGTVGGGGRVEFTVIGDVVNTAARVEAATRETGDDVLITDATRERMRIPLELEERPPVPLKGKRVEVGLWAPRFDGRDRRNDAGGKRARRKPGDNPGTRATAPVGD